MASRFTIPVADVGSGIKPADGAKLGFFELDGVTPKDTFTTEALTIANSNPVIADSSGVFPDIWYSGSLYVVLTDKNDVQKGQWDPVNETANVASAAFPKNFDTLEGGPAATSAVENESLVEGDALNIAERATGNGGGAMWKAVLSTSVVENTYDIVQCTGVPTLSLVLRVELPLNVKQLGAVGDGATNDYGAIQHALNGYPHLYFPDGDYLCQTSLVLDFDHALRLEGAGRRTTTISNDTDDVFDVGGANDATFFHIDELKVLSKAGGGHCFNVAFTTSMFKIENSVIQNENTGKGLWNQTTGYSGGGIVENCRLIAAVGVTVNPWFIRSNEIVNGWSFRNLRCDNSSGTNQFFNIDTTNGSSFNTNIEFFNITFELTNGGMILVGGAKHILIHNIGAYDLNATQTGHGVRVVQSVGGLNSSRISIRNVQKSPTAGYSLAANIYDIKLDSGASAVTELVNVDSNVGTTNIDYGNNSVVHILTPSSPVVVNDIKVTTINGDNITISGEIIAEGFQQSTGETWEINGGAPEGVVTAEAGSILSRSAASNAQALYVKLTGSGNTGWNIAPVMEFRDSAGFLDAANSINTSGKSAGVTALDSTTTKTLVATGALAVDTWDDLAGNVVYTPV
jgi:hypothetical protein